jgi:hypothetical protein
MSNIIEFVGPRGAGKSTICKNFLENESKSGVYKRKEFFTPYIFSKYNGVIGILESIVRKRLNKGFINHSKLKFGTYQFSEKYPKYSKFVWEMISKYHAFDFKGVDNRINLSSDVGRYWAGHHNIVESPIKKICIMDEDLIHLSIIVFNNYLNQVELEKYLSYVPLPKAVIYCYATPKILSERCFTRRLVFPHIGRTLSELAELAKIELDFYNIIIDVLEEKQIPILRIDTEASQDVNLKISTFLSKLPIVD